MGQGHVGTPIFGQKGHGHVILKTSQKGHGHVILKTRVPLHPCMAFLILFHLRPLSESERARSLS